MRSCVPAVCVFENRALESVLFSNAQQSIDGFSTESERAAGAGPSLFYSLWQTSSSSLLLLLLDRAPGARSVLSREGEREQRGENEACS